MYALKKQVAVMASPPYYTLFVEPYRIGSIHDYNILKATSQHYTGYLAKTESELREISIDRSQRYWSMILDKVYGGPQSDTPNLRKIVPLKTPILQSDIENNQVIGKLRVQIECVFGRMQKLWGIFRKVYTLDHDNFDMDFDNCILLTNEDIRNNHPLSEDDRILYQLLTQQRREKREKAIEKRKGQQQKYQYRLKRKLDELVESDLLE